MSDLSTEKRKLVLTAGLAGNVVEWYDFALYGFMASLFSRIFFPQGDGVANLIAVYGIFAAGFVMRPLGSVMFGWLGDRIGRSPTMMISVALMALPTFLLGLLPPYEAIGLAAPILLVALRLLQGLSVGGEFSTSVVYLVETAPEGKRGRSGSFANLGSIGGTALGSLGAMAVMNLLAQPDLEAWGWRIPYLFGGVLGVASLILRRHLPKSPAFEAQEEARVNDHPIGKTFTEVLPQTIKATVFAGGYGVFFYVAMVYFPNWLQTQAGLQLDLAMRVNTAVMILALPLVPVFGWVSDRFVPRKWLAAGALLLVAAGIWPALWASLAGGFWTAAAAQAALVFALAALLGSGPALFAELFPAENRNSGYSISYAIGMGIVGGATPMTATWLIEVMGSSLAPAVFVSAAAALSAVAAMTMKDRSRMPLHRGGEH